MRRRWSSEERVKHIYVANESMFIPTDIFAKTKYGFSAPKPNERKKTEPKKAHSTANFGHVSF